MARIVFGLAVALLSVLLLGPAALEFWTKTAILASLVIACGLRFPVAAFLARGDDSETRPAPAGFRSAWRAPAAVFVGVFSLGFLPLSADLSTRAPQPAAGLSDGTTPAIPLSVGSGPGIAGWVDATAADALPPPGQDHPLPTAASALIWRLPPVPAITIPANVTNFDSKLTPAVAAQMGHDLVLDLIIEAEARRSLDLKLAQQGAIGDGLKEFTDVIGQDQASAIIVLKTYTFTQATLSLFLPKFTTQAARLIGVTLIGTVLLTTWDRSGHQLSQTRQTYSKSWSVGATASDGHLLIDNDYTGLQVAG